MVGSVLNEGLRGLQNSQRELVRAASDVARANIGSDAPAQATDPALATPLAPVEETAQSERSQDISEPLIELRRQELLFTASAEVVSTANEALGSLLDTEA